MKSNIKSKKIKLNIFKLNIFKLNIIKKMNGLLKKAKAKKLKFTNYMKNKEISEDSDGDISEDDIDTLEEDMLGTILNDKYIITKYVGKGTFCRTWQVFNYVNNKHYIAKIYNKDSNQEYKNELCILKQLTSYQPDSDINLTYVDNFEKGDQNSQSTNITILPRYGMPLDDFLYKVEKDGTKIPLNTIKKIFKSICKSVSTMHELNILHTDIKLDNVLTNYFDINSKNFDTFVQEMDIQEKMLSIENELIGDTDYDNMNKNQKKKFKKKIKQRLSKKIKDFYYLSYEKYHNNLVSKEEKCTLDMLNNLTFTLCDYSNSILEKEVSSDDEYQIRGYRALENILSIGYTKSSETWALGSILWDLITNDNLFEPDLIKYKDSLSRDRAQLALMERYLGKVSKDITLDCSRTFELYDDNGKILKHKKVERVELEKYLKEKRNDLSDEEIVEVVSFLRECWNYSHKHRKIPEQILSHEFLL
jgi:serine/threonine-protein kinase SRPK3